MPFLVIFSPKIEALTRLGQSYQLFFNTAAAAAGGAAPSARVGPTAGEPAAAAPPANGFRILAPADGSEVRERVRVVIPASAVPQNGSVTLFIDGRFILGVAPTRYDETLEYTWNTKDPLPGKETAEKRVPKDGSHIIRAHVIDPAGQIVQVAESTVNLRNLLSEPEVASDGVLLRYRFQPGLDLYYRNRFTADVLAPGSQKRLHEGEIRSGILFEDWS
ncbi:MAG: hypothetical protein HYU47_11215, partial [Deltaproteobacteria bacterium]|nr:hypothetical protein [Deltaproteobacteria bacterium]